MLKYTQSKGIAVPGIFSTKCHIFRESVVGMREGFLFFEFFRLSDILNKEQLGFGQIAHYLNKTVKKGKCTKIMANGIFGLPLNAYYFILL